MSAWQSWKSHLCAALFVGALFSQSAVAVPVLSFTASPNPGQVGSPLGVDVRITGITDLYAYQFSLAFDPTVLQAVGSTEGSFLSAGGSTFFIGGAIDNTLGSISFVGDALTGSVPGVSGDGLLVHFDFGVTRAGSSALSFSDVLFLDSAFNAIGVQIANGTVVTVGAVPEPATLALFGVALLGIAATRSRRAG